MHIKVYSTHNQNLLKYLNFNVSEENMTKQNKPRCAWAKDDEQYLYYHDHEWGVPVYDDRLLFEYLILEGAQAGLSWLTILKRRQNYKKAFDNFDAKKIARYSDKKLKLLITDSGIIRNRLKIQATVINAKAFLAVQKEYGSFAEYIWQFVKGKPQQNNWRSSKDVPASTDISLALSQDLRKRGFKFVGSTICYAFMQAVGMVNDHTLNCYRHKQLSKSKRKK